MIVAKFGGTSVNTKEGIAVICHTTQKNLAQKPILVVSALRGVTDLLLSLETATNLRKKQILGSVAKTHKDFVKKLFSDKKTQKEINLYIDDQIKSLAKLTKRTIDKQALDSIVSFGEIMSSYIVTKALLEHKISAKQVLATELIVTDDTFGNASWVVAPTKTKVTKTLLPLIKKGIVPVVTGFIAATKDKKTTTLGRGGSDYTASIIGFCLEASEIQIWTDVDGLFTSDPRLVKTARLLKTVSFEEASEMATFGSRVLHPRTIRPATKAGIPVRVLNTHNINGEGTLIVEKPVVKHPITAIACKKNITLVNIYSFEMLLAKGFLAKVFTVFAKHDISIDLVSVSEVSISVSLDNTNHLEDAVLELEKFAKVVVVKHLGMVSLIGVGIVTSTHAIHSIFDLLHKEKILVKMVSLGATDINVSLVIDGKLIDHTVLLLHDRLLMKKIHYLRKFV